MTLFLYDIMYNLARSAQSLRDTGMVPDWRPGIPTKVRQAVALAAPESIPLVGMRLLDRHNLKIEVESGGRVLIQARE